MKAKLTQLTGTKVMDSNFADYQTLGDPECVPGLIYEQSGQFTNIYLSDEFILSELLIKMQYAKKSGTVVVDYSSPNAAKELHVGHLRSTLVGDCIANVLQAVGYTVIKQNHIGDKCFTAQIDKAEAFEKMHNVYGKLNVGLTPADVTPESFYHGEDVLPLIDVFAVDGSLQMKVGDESVVLVKSDGVDTYFLTDLAAIHYRLFELNANKIIYVTDFRQKDHFKKLFKAVVDLGWAAADQLVHLTTGCVLGKDNKPLKTRDGNTPKLADLIDEAIAATTDEAIGIGVLKYGELSINKSSDYAFDLEKATSTKGNTAAYLQYTCARLLAVLNACGHWGTVTFENDYDKTLAKELLKWVDVIDNFEHGYKPSDITTYLYGLAKVFNMFYEQGGKIVGAENEAMKVILLVKTWNVFKAGLNLLGIQILEKI